MFYSPVVEEEEQDHGEDDGDHGHDQLEALIVLLIGVSETRQNHSHTKEACHK